MRAILAIVCLTAGPTMAAPVTYDYSLPCFMCGDDTSFAHVSLTLDDSGFDAWDPFGREALIDFTVSATDGYAARRSDMFDTEFFGYWGNRPGTLPVFTLTASQNATDYSDPFKPGLTVAVGHERPGGMSYANLGLRGTMSSMADYKPYASPVPIPVPATGGLMAAALLLLAAVGLRARPVGRFAA